MPNVDRIIHGRDSLGVAQQRGHGCKLGEAAALRFRPSGKGADYQAFDGRDDTHAEDPEREVADDVGRLCLGALAQGRPADRDAAPALLPALADLDRPEDLARWPELMP